MPYPFIDHNPIYYQHLGSSHSIPILMIHPPLLTSDVFYYQMNELSKQYQIITPDLRGHGQSPVSKQPLTYSLIVQDLIELLNRLKLEKVYLCGYSTGGSVALEALLTAPHRFYGAILLSAMPESTNLYLRTMLPLASFFSRPGLFPLLLHTIVWGNADTGDTFLRLYQTAEKGNPTNIGQYYQASQSFFCTDQLSHIHLPVLLLYGEKNPTFHSYSHQMHTLLPNSTEIMIPQVSHQLPTKAHAQVNQAIKIWIDEKERG